MRLLPGALLRAILFLALVYGLWASLDEDGFWADWLPVAAGYAGLLVLAQLRAFGSGPVAGQGGQGSYLKGLLSQGLVTVIALLVAWPLTPGLSWPERVTWTVAALLVMSAFARAAAVRAGRLAPP